MIVLSEQKLNLLFEEISGGFTHSPLEISAFIFIILSFLAPFLFLYVYQLKKQNAEKFRVSQKIYKRLVSMKELAGPDLELLQQMVRYLKKGQKKYLLLEDQSVFNSCARKLQKEKHVSAASMAALRLKLGFKREKPEQTPHSSAQLPEDLPVIMQQKGKKQCTGKLLKSELRSLVIELESGGISSRSRSPVQVYFQNSAGMYSFTTYVQNCKNGLIKAAHSENIKRLQRRNFYRRKLNLPVYIKPKDSEERHVRSTLVDLGGGGASLINTEMNFRPSDGIDLFFSTSKESRIALSAEVIRVSGDGQTLHVAFGHMPESSRDRIIHYLFRNR